MTNARDSKTQSTAASELSCRSQEQKGREGEATEISRTVSTIQDRRKLLKIYAFDAIVGMVIFCVFAMATAAIEYLAEVIQQREISATVVALMRIIGWSISALGAVCAIALVVRNAYDFLKLLRRNPQQFIADREVSDGRRTT